MKYKCLVIFLIFLPIVLGFYLPELAPKNYCRSDHTLPSCESGITLYVNRLNTEESVIPYEYHHFDFCPINETKSPVENLGQEGYGEGKRPGPYNIEFLKSETCKTACKKVYQGGDSDSEKKLMVLKKGISLNYQHHWIVDNMPVTWCYTLEDSKQHCNIGFPIGCLVRKDTSCPSLENTKLGSFYIFNHVDLVITYHSGESEEWGTAFGIHGGRIISVKVTPRSIDHQNGVDCNNKEPLSIPSNVLSPTSKLEITYTYSIAFKEDNSVKWSFRWDYIFESMPQSHTSIQWFSILNSLVIVLFLSGMVVMIIIILLLIRSTSICNVSLYLKKLIKERAFLEKTEAR